MSITIQYLCGPQKVDAQRYYTFKDLTDARDGNLAKRVDLGRAVILIQLLEAPCTLRVRRSDLRDHLDRDVLAGMLAAANSHLVLCETITGDIATGEAEWTLQPGRSEVADDVTALSGCTTVRSAARDDEELADIAQSLHEGLDMTFRAIAPLLNAAERATGDPRWREVNEQRVSDMCSTEFSPVTSPEQVQRMKAAGLTRTADLDLTDIGPVDWIEVARALLLTSTSPLVAESFTFDDQWGLLTPIRWQVAHRLAERSGGQVYGTFRGRLSPAEIATIDPLVDFVRDVQAKSFMLMIPRPGDDVILEIRRMLSVNESLTFDRIAYKLNERGFPTRTRGEWHAASVREVMGLAGLKLPRG